METSGSYDDERRQIRFYEDKLGREMESPERVAAEEIERNDKSKNEIDVDVMHDLS